MAKFSMTDILNDRSKKEGEKESFKIRLIDIGDIRPDERNFYNTDDIDELRASIEMFGLQQNLVVKETIEGKYSLISGHRRFKALKSLIESGEDKYKLVPCKVETEIDEMMSELQLIMANSTTRELSDYEKTHQAQKIKELLLGMKKNGAKIPGKLRDIVADTLKVSSTQVARMESINNNLSDDFKEEFRDEKVNISTAYELSGLPKEKQDVAYEEYKEKGDLSIKDVKKIKDTNVLEGIDELETKSIEEDMVHEQVEEQRPLKVYVCNTEDKRFATAEYIDDVVKAGHIPLNAQAILYGLKGIEADDALRMLSKELISIADEVWVYGSPTGDRLPWAYMIELNTASNLKKTVVYKDDNAEYEPY